MHQLAENRCVPQVQGAYGPGLHPSLLNLRQRARAPWQTFQACLEAAHPRDVLQYATANEKSQILGQTGLRPGACSEKAEEARVS